MGGFEKRSQCIPSVEDSAVKSWMKGRQRWIPSPHTIQHMVGLGGLSGLICSLIGYLDGTCHSMLHMDFCTFPFFLSSFSRILFLWLI